MRNTDWIVYVSMYNGITDVHRYPNAWRRTVRNIRSPEEDPVARRPSDINAVYKTLHRYVVNYQNLPSAEEVRKTVRPEWFEQEKAGLLTSSK